MFPWWNVFLLLPSLSLYCLCLSAWGLWDCGRASLSRQRAVLPNCVHLGFGVSLSLPYCILSSPLFIPPFSQNSFGVAEASRTLLFSVPLALLSLSPSSTHSCIMRHIQLKTKFVSCASITALHFHLLISLSLLLSILGSLSIPMWGFKYGFAGYHSPLSPRAYITVSGLLWNTTALLTGRRFKFSSLDLKCNNIDLIWS